ncbi:MAG: ftsB [Gammaproteobacteria bacterium]|nr:ftsB [Gammaproteobacteria bacterium]
MKPHAIFITILSVLFVLLQYKLWFSEAGYRQYAHLKEKLIESTEQNMELQKRNSYIAAEVDNLKRGADAVEEHARNELGLIKPGETFYQIIE